MCWSTTTRAIKATTDNAAIKKNHAAPPKVTGGATRHSQVMP